MPGMFMSIKVTSMCRGDRVDSGRGPDQAEQEHRHGDPDPVTHATDTGGVLKASRDRVHAASGRTIWHDVVTWLRQSNRTGWTP
jgi:hypothetical protein